MDGPKVEIVFKSGGSEGINAFNASVERLTSSMDELKASMGGIKNTAASIKQPMEEVKNQFDVFIARQFKLNQAFEGFSRMKESFDVLTAPAIEFDAAQKQLQSTTGVTNAELDELGLFAREAGKALGSTGAEVLGGMEKIANGIEISKIGGVAGLKELTYQVSMFAKASNVDFETAAKAVIGAKGQFNLSAAEISRAMNVMARGSQIGSGEVVDQIESFKVAAAVASDFGISIEETTAAVELLAGVNIKGSEAGTTLRNMLGGMKSAGVDFSQGLTEALQQVNGKMLDYNGITKMVGRDAVVGFKTLAKQTDEMKRLTAETTGTNAVTEIASVKMSTFAQDIAVARAQVNDLLVGFGGLIAGGAKYLEYLSMAGQALFAVSQISISFIEVTRMVKAIQWASALTSMKDTYAKIAQAFATYGLVGANGALVVSFNLLKQAMLANPFTAVIAGLVAMGAAVYALWENFDWFRGGVYAAWEGLKMVFDGIVGQLKSIWGLVEGITTGDWSTLQEGMKQMVSAGDVSRVTKSFEAGKADFKAEADAEAETEKILAQEKQNLANLQKGLVTQTTGGAAEQAGGQGLGFAPTVPGAELGAGTSAANGGVIISAPSGGGGTTNSQTVNVSAINITVTTPRDLVEQVKKEVLEAITKSLSPSVGMALSR